MIRTMIRTLAVMLAVSLVAPVRAADEPAADAPTPAKLKALVLDGQNNHNWKSTTPLIQRILENCGRFTVDVSTSPDNKADPAAWDAWRPKFADYAVVVSNYNGQHWPQPVKDAFVEYVAGGGGFVVVHAANNAFGDWPQYNRMIGLGGWGGRNEKTGPYLRLRDANWQRVTSAGRGGGHGAQHEFVITTRAPEHPITQGLPEKWMHAKDELYDSLRGPAEGVTILASAYSDKSTKGSGEDEPLLMAIDYEKGRVFHSALGHADYSMHGVGFQITLQRGAEWAATGKVTIPAPPADALPADKAGLIDPMKVETAG